MSMDVKTKRWVALGVLWAVVGMGGWLMVVQFLLVTLTPAGSWQWPAVRKVVVVAIDNDPQSAFTDIAVQSGDEAEEGESISLLKKEREGLRVGDQVWVLDNYYHTRLRPPQFRLTPQRLLLEYPEPLLILALWAILRLRRAQARTLAQENDPNRPRTVIRDDFHTRAGRKDQ